MTDVYKAQTSPGRSLFLGLLTWFVVTPSIFLSYPAVSSYLPQWSLFRQSIDRKTTGIEGDDLL